MPSEDGKPEKKFVNTLPCLYLVSVASSWCAEMVTYPVDLTKTRLQIQGEIANSKELSVGAAPKRGFLGMGYGIIREEGFFKLWKGVHAAFLRHAIYGGTRIVIYKTIKDKLVVTKENGEKYFPLWMSALFGAGAGGFGQFIASPADLMKVQMQMEGKRRLMGLPPRVHGMWDAFTQVLRKSGWTGLWKGAIPNSQRAALVNLGDLTTYDVVKRALLNNTSLRDGPIVHVTASFFAGFVAALIGTPADVVKTRVMNQPIAPDGRPMFYKNSVDCMIQTVGKEGFFALYKGFIAHWVRLVPFALSFWIAYENIQHFIGGASF